MSLAAGGLPVYAGQGTLASRGRADCRNLKGEVLSVDRHRKLAKRRPRHYVPHLAWCDEHQKFAFTRDAARRVRRKLHDPGIRAYECTPGDPRGWFHVGHLPEDVKRGVRTAREHYRREAT